MIAIHPNHPDQLYFAKIEYFAKLDIKDNCKASTISVWTACVSFYDEHPCKVWYGGLTQVWTRTSSFDVFYIPLLFIKTRVAYSEAVVDFGRIIGKQTVYVVSLVYLIHSVFVSYSMDLVYVENIVCAYVTYVCI